MTNAKHPGDETNDASERGYGDSDGDSDALKQELFAAWTAAHPDGGRQQFDDEWAAMTNDTRPSLATDESPSDRPASWDQDPVVLKRRMFEEWKARFPDGTHAQFDAEWNALTSIRGV